MKKILFLLATALLFLSNNIFAQYDDVYYDPSRSNTSTTKVLRDEEVEEIANSIENNQLDGQESNDVRASRYDGVEASDGNTYITNNYYDDDNYNDFFYTSRLRRFYQPNFGFGYWNNCYTNYYFYDNNPMSWGNNIYSYTPNYYWNPWGIFIGYSTWGSQNGWNWGRPCYSAWYDPYGWNSGWNNNYCGYNGYYGYNNGFNNGYYNGYNNGYYDGYNNGYNNNFAYGGGSSYDYWGPRKQMMDPDGLPSNTNSVKTANAIDNGRNNMAAPNNPSQVSTGKASDYSTKSDVPLNVKREPTQISNSSTTVNEIPKTGIVTKRSNNTIVAPSTSGNVRSYNNNSTGTVVTPDSRIYQNENAPVNGNYGRTEINSGSSSGNNRPVNPPTPPSNNNNYSRPNTPPSNTAAPSNNNVRPVAPSNSTAPSNNNNARPVTPPNNNTNRTVTPPINKQSTPPSTINRSSGNVTHLNKPR